MQTSVVTSNTRGLRSSLTKGPNSTARVTSNTRELERNTCLPHLAHSDSTARVTSNTRETARVPIYKYIEVGRVRSALPPSNILHQPTPPTTRHQPDHQLSQHSHEPQGIAHV